MEYEERARWQRLARLFDQAVSLSAEERAAFLDRACEGDDSLRRQVAELLQSSDRASGFLDEPYEPTTSGSVPHRLAGETSSDDAPPSPDSPSQASTHAQAPLGSAAELIGPYRLIDKIGEGGMGEVWRAEQVVPIRRQVALKLIKRGMDTRQVVARFEAERQALAWMDHPAIARVYDAGETPRGLPFFVMELVQGVPITEYCDRERLTVRERLDLFNQVCEGVQHAHQRGIIHRDLKPSNILVTVEGQRPVPKIIDFGVAKATAAQLTDNRLYTELGMMIGTPEYMSPEQAEMTAAGVDTRTDVYSLGVILYELLTGTLPFDSREMREASYEEIRRRIREEDPPKPSTRVSSLGKRLSAVAESRRTEPARLASRLKGELDWIVLRAMEKDRTRRYGSPGELAADIQRSLRNEPVLAGPPSGLYRARKFVRRHRVGVTIATVAVMSLLAFAVTMWVQSARIAREKRRADREAEASRRVTDFLVGLFRAPDPGVSQGQTITARELLDRGAERIEKDLNTEPLVKASLMMTMGVVYQNLDLHQDAESFLEKSLSERQRLLGPEHPDTLKSMFAVAVIYFAQAKFDQAEKLTRETLALRSRVFGENDRSTLACEELLARIYVGTGRPRAAADLLDEKLRAHDGWMEVDDSVTLHILSTLANANDMLGRYPASERLSRAALERMLKQSANENLGTLQMRVNIGWTCFLQGKYDEARTQFRKGFEVSGKVYGPNHGMTMMNQAGLVATSFFLESREDAMATQERHLEWARRATGPNGLATLQNLFALGMMNLIQGRYAQAEELMRESSDGFRRVTGPKGYNTLWALNYLAVAAYHEGKLEEAQRILESVVPVNKEMLGPDHPHTRDSMSHLADVYTAEERYSEAETLYKEALAEVPPETWQNPKTRSASFFGLAGLEARRGERTQALGHLRQAVESGFDNPQELSRSPLLASLRSDPAFAELTTAVQGNLRRREPTAPAP
jgi:serine/threonine protein kinase/tetratricopeptide (TPR) repeat protein